MTNEIWKSISSFDRYEVSTKGTVRKKNGPDSLGRTTYSGKVLKPFVRSKTGYLSVGLWDGERQVNVHVHRIVALTFLGPPPPNMIVNHKDGNKLNPRLENLEYCTYAENFKHAADILGVSPPRGQSHWATHLTDADVRRIRKLLSTMNYSYQQIADLVGTSKNIVGQIKRGMSWAHIN